MKPKPLHGLTGKPGNAAKPESERASSKLIARVRPEDKATWVRAANARGWTLARWVIDVLNRSSQ
jgi:predicted HicB family RNase H-like nuclease